MVIYQKPESCTDYKYLQGVNTLLSRFLDRFRHVEFQHSLLNILFLHSCINEMDNALDNCNASITSIWNSLPFTTLYITLLVRQKCTTKALLLHYQNTTSALLMHKQCITRGSISALLIQYQCITSALMVYHCMQKQIPGKLWQSDVCIESHGGYYHTLSLDHWILPIHLAAFLQAVLLANSSSSQLMVQHPYCWMDRLTSLSLLSLSLTLHHTYHSSTTDSTIIILPIRTRCWYRIFAKCQSIVLVTVEEQSWNVHKKIRFPSTLAYLFRCIQEFVTIHYFTFRINHFYLVFSLACRY